MSEQCCSTNLQIQQIRQLHPGPSQTTLATYSPTNCLQDPDHNLQSPQWPSTHIYISGLLAPYTPATSLRSSDSELPVIPRSRTNKYGGRTFKFAAPPCITPSQFLSDYPPPCQYLSHVSKLTCLKVPTLTTVETCPAPWPLPPVPGISMKARG